MRTHVLHMFHRYNYSGTLFLCEPTQAYCFIKHTFVWNGQNCVLCMCEDVFTETRVYTMTQPWHLTCSLCSGAEPYRLVGIVVL